MMRKFFTKLSLLAGLILLTSCGGTKQAQQSTLAELEKLKQEVEIAKLKNELEIEKMKSDAEKERLRDQLAVNEKLERGTQVLLTFCIDEAMDKPGEYMAGLGISQGQLDQKDVLISANQVALSDITSRFLGVMKNGVEMYNKETNTTARNKAKESQLEGLAMSFGEKAINKHANVVCRKIAAEREGTYRAYVAVHVPIKDVVDEVANELEVAKVDIDKALFRKKMQAQLDADAAKVRAEQERQKEELQQQLGE